MRVGVTEEDFDHIGRGRVERGNQSQRYREVMDKIIVVCVPA
jgi:hypothetical protein